MDTPHGNRPMFSFEVLRDPVSIMNVPLQTLKSKRKDCTLRVLHAQIQMKKYCLFFGLSAHAHYLCQHRGVDRLVSHILI